MAFRSQSDEAARRLARHGFAEGRASRVGLQFLSHLAVIALAAIFIPPGWAAPTAALSVVARLAERRAAQAFLAAGNDARDAAWRRLAAVSLAGEAAPALAVGMLWLWTEPGRNGLPLSLLFLLAFAVAIESRQTLGLAMVRQCLYATLAVALTLRDLAQSGAVAALDVATQLAPAAVFAAAALGLTLWSARAQRQYLLREHGFDEARMAAERADRAKAGFIATLGHELRTPLNGILGMAQALLAGGLAPQQRRQVEVIAESGRSMTLLLDDILDFSKLEAGKLAISPAPDDLRRTAEHLERLYSPLAVAKGLAFRVRVAPGTPSRLMFDAMRVRQCLSNLISNAIKFTEAGSVEVAIAATPQAADPARWTVTTTVTDTGIGIPAERQAGLFQPYSQADGSIARRFGGTGLGLSITRQLAEAMGGSVTVTSAPDEGSEFRLAFIAGSVPGAGGDAPAVPSLAEIRVLIADDVATNRTVMRLLLQPLGAAVVEAADGEAALGALAGASFDAALIDLNMPGLGGAELASRIRDGAGGQPDLPLIAVTAGGGIAPGADGFDAVVAKPVDRDRLRTAIADAIRHRARPTDRGGIAAVSGGPVLPRAPDS